MDSDLRVGIRVLAVLPGAAVAVLDREHGAVMQASEADLALDLDPHGPALHDLDRAGRAFLGTEPTSGTGVVHREVLSVPRQRIGLVGEGPGERCSLQGDEIPLVAVLDRFYTPKSILLALAFLAKSRDAIANSLASLASLFIFQLPIKSFLLILSNHIDAW